MRILLAVSGGIDSVSMADLALCGRILPDAEGFAVVHCNFSLRGDESDSDEALVREFAGAHSLDCHIRRFDTAAYALSNGISIEMAARELRYSYFREICLSEGFGAVAVAHNADDNAETLLLNLVRGTGTKGLRGMAAESDNLGVKVLRPLLGWSRKQIEAYALDRALVWHEDRTNSQTVFKRNKIRHEVLPVLGELNPSILKTLAGDMERIAQVDDIAQEYFLEASKTCLCPDGSVDLKRTVEFRHWKYLLYRFTRGRLNADQLLRLQNSVESGRPLGGKRFGPYVVRRGKLVIPV